MLQDLAIKQLLQNQMLPYLIAGAAAVSVAVDRASRVMAELSTVQGLIQGQCNASEWALICTLDQLAKTPVISHNPSGIVLLSFGFFKVVMIFSVGSSKVLEPFSNFLSAKARALEAQQNKRVPGNVQLAKQLAQMLAAVGNTARSQELLAAFPS